MASWNARIWTRLCLCAWVALVSAWDSMSFAVVVGSQDGVQVGSGEVSPSASGAPEGSGAVNSVQPVSSPSASAPVVDVRSGDSGLAAGIQKAKPTLFEEILGNPLLVASVMFAVLYLGVLLPAQRSTKRSQREQEEQLANLKKNDRVVTSFGVHGVVVGTQPDAKTVTIRIDESSNAKLTVNRDTIRVVKKD